MKPTAALVDAGPSTRTSTPTTLATRTASRAIPLPSPCRSSSSPRSPTSSGGDWARLPRFASSATLGSGAFVTVPVEDDDWLRIAQLVSRYRDLPLGTVDASTVAAAERLGIRTIATLDRRRFGVVRPAHADAFELIPWSPDPSPLAPSSARPRSLSGATGAVGDSVGRRRLCAESSGRSRRCTGRGSCPRAPPEDPPCGRRVACPSLRARAGSGRASRALPRAPCPAALRAVARLVA